MDGEWWKQVETGLRFPEKFLEVKMSIPRFKLSYERTLNNDLMSLGMKTPFEESADFSLMSSQKPLFISQASQKTFAELDEEGMRVAAATLLEVVSSDLHEYTKVDFNVNRPFLYFIKEKSTGIVFLTGIMNQIL